MKISLAEIKRHKWSLGAFLKDFSHQAKMAMSLPDFFPEILAILGCCQDWVGIDDAHEIFFKFRLATLICDEVIHSHYMNTDLPYWIPGNWWVRWPLWSPQVSPGRVRRLKLIYHHPSRWGRWHPGHPVYKLSHTIEKVGEKRGNHIIYELGVQGYCNSWRQLYYELHMIPIYCFGYFTKVSARLLSYLKD